MSFVDFPSYEQEKNRINKDGEIVISSTKTRTQKLISAHFSFLLYILVLCSQSNWFHSAILLQG